ncbi:uncharacterized LabA/DUF88 family protein [Aureimonas jatrophae]|nr:uncharacterized LabA/DUF88 family protein [Aureimonas jatrophae]
MNDPWGEEGMPAFLRVLPAAAESAPSAPEVRQPQHRREAPKSPQAPPTPSPVAVAASPASYSFSRRPEAAMSDVRSPRLAVLIDADNASARIADGLFQEIATIGEASVRRIYGDFSSPRSKGWADVLSRHAILPQQQFAYVTGKNASDIALVIDAMDLMHSGRFDGFCLVSSDSDFTRLASRIREHGVDVYGFGEQKTPESFRQACRRFIYTENLLHDLGERAKAEAAATPDPLPMVRQVMEQMESDDGWVPLGAFGQQLLNRFSDFDPRTYGHKKLSDFVRAVGIFDVEKTPGGMLRIRLQPTPPPASAQPAAKPPSRRRTPAKPKS